MDRRTMMIGLAAGAGALGSCAAAGTTAPTPATSLPPVPQAETDATITAMRPPKRPRPVVAIIADNRGAETTDLLIPYGVLSRSGLADVVVVAPQASVVQLMPALKIMPQATLAGFDARHPDGADYVIVPAFHHDDGRPALDWIRDQARRGATIVGVCSGAKVLAKAGLLDGRRATSHWADVSGLRRAHPTMTWVQDRRYVADRGVVTTTGVTASLPMSLALVEAIGGRADARTLALDLGVPDYDARHDSAAFSLTGDWIAQAIGNTAAFWSHETVGLPVASDADEIALGFVADAYSRTYRSQARTTGPSPTVNTRHGLELVVDLPGARPAVDFTVAAPDAGLPAQSLDQALADIAGRYGDKTAAFVALQLEYPWTARGRNRTAPG